MATLPGQRSETPPKPPTQPTHVAPDPPRYLGQHGRALWDRAWERGRSWVVETEVELLLLVCEQTDERQALRVQVLRDNDWRERAGLRALDRAIQDGLTILGVGSSAATVVEGDNDEESPVASIAARRAARVARTAALEDANRRSQPRRRARGD
jgi:hypothetical protein